MELRSLFLTSAVQSDFTMEPKTIFIIAAVIFAIVFLVLWRKEKEKSKRGGASYRPTPPSDYHLDDSGAWRDRSTPSPSGSGKRPVVMTGPSTRTPPVKPGKVVPAARPAQRSLDAEYADRHNLWICPHCETMNSHASGRCAACGMIYGKGGDYHAM